jgi:hypothetical protein
MAPGVSWSRFTLRIDGGSAFYVKHHYIMSTKYGIQISIFIGFLGFGVGLYGYWQALGIRRAIERSGDTSKLAALHILTITTEIALWGGLALMLISLIIYFLYRRWSRADHDA